MTTEIKVPVLPESVTDAIIAAWHKAPGESVKRDENIVDLETDKVVLEIPAPADGVLRELKVSVGDVVEANQLIAVFEEGVAAPTNTAESVSVESSVESSNASVASGNAPILSPAARVMAEERNIDPNTISGSGKDGRITKEDVEKASKASANAESSATQETAPQPEVAVTPSEHRQERREPMSRLRQTIANRLVQSQQTAAILTTFNEVDLKAVMDIRKNYKEAFEKKTGARLGFMSFFVKATCEALAKYPAVNAYIEGDDVVYHDYCDVGIAVSSPRGLVVPVLRNAETLGFADIENGIRDFGLRARDGKLAMDELAGGTFTITNGGVFGSMLSTPIINPPQSGILGMHNIVERPMAVNGNVEIRPMMYLALSYDHRIIDGKEAVSFLVTIKESLEDPSRMLLGL